ncbi:MAG: bacteriohemerythrin [Halarcobacter ebronensis]|uniref:bacteriohemerythrin n=1 Tax=Halarcobacter ebronensis TaxID=1462615 RepID=UPI003C75FCC4
MLINKNDLPLVAEDFMNDVHYEDVDIINDLYEKLLNYIASETKENKNIVIDTYQDWYDHTVSHFKGEEDKMIELNFPPYMMHKGEHEKCLEQMRQVLDYFIKNDDKEFLKSYLELDLINWLVNHIQTMDTVTAMFFKTGMSPCSAH